MLSDQERIYVIEKLKAERRRIDEVVKTIEYKRGRTMLYSGDSLDKLDKHRALVGAFLDMVARHRGKEMTPDEILTGWKSISKYERRKW